MKNVINNDLELNFSNDESNAKSCDKSNAW